MKARKIAVIVLSLVLCLAVFAGCSSNKTKTLKVGATPNPHAELLNQVKTLLAEQGVTLEIVEFTDYPLINAALADGSIDANFFQHQPYLDDYNTNNKTELISAGQVHYEPMGIFAGKTASLEELADGATIAVPNDATNEARALLLLEAEGLITLAEDAGINATKTDIVENPKNLNIEELAAEQLPRSLSDVDLAVINGNYALQGGLKVTDALAIEAADSLAAETYANVVAVRKGDETREDIQKLVKALNSETIREYINSTYEGAVVPKF